MATDASIAVITPTSEAYETNVRSLLQAQQLATAAALAGRYTTTTNSVPVTITPDSSAWSFTVACEITAADLAYDGSPDERVVDINLPYVGIDDLVETVQTTIQQARQIIDIVLV